MILIYLIVQALYSPRKAKDFVCLSFKLYNLPQCLSGYSKKISNDDDVDDFVFEFSLSYLHIDS